MRCKAGILAGIAVAFLSTGDLWAADNFTASDVLGWKEKSQNWYFETSMAMAAVVAAENPGAQAECVDDWYFKQSETANTEIRAVFERFPDYHPATVMLAVIERECGSFNFTK